MQTNELQDDTKDASEFKNIPHDKTERLNVDRETIIKETKKSKEETAQSNAFAGLLILCELATSLLKPEATEQHVIQSVPHSNTQSSAVYEKNKKSKQRKQITEQTDLFLLAELAAALSPIELANEPLKPEDNMPEMTSYKHNNAVGYEYGIPSIDIVDTQDTSTVTPPPNYVEFDNAATTVDTVGPHEDTPPMTPSEFEEFLEYLVQGEGTSVTTPPQDDDDLELEQFVYNLIH